MTFAVGDIHGCFDKLQLLLSACERIRAGQDARFIFIGDYIDRGPDSRRVVDFLIRQQAERPDIFICLRGNHEDMLLSAAAAARTDRDFLHWWSNGGEQTLASYGLDDPRDLPAEHLAWIRTLPLTMQEPGRLYVHAGIRPGVPLSRQSEQDLLWIREPFLSSDEDHGIFVVHGHTPSRTGKPELRPNRLNLDTAACFGGPLTAAVFAAGEIGPAMFVTDHGDRVRLPRE